VAAPADVVILNSDCRVSEGWLDGLREAAYVDSRVATATALTNHGSIVSVPERRPVRGMPPGWSFDDAAAAIRTSSLRLRPRLPTAVGHCTYIRRSALELVGDFDPAFSPGYGEEVDFSQRCRVAGLCHVVADDVLVLHQAGGSFGTGVAPSAIREQHERMIAVRYPYYHDEVGLIQDDAVGPLARAMGVARRALNGLSVVIDASVLTGPMTGTQMQVIEVITALARTQTITITALVPENMSEHAQQTLGGLDNVKQLTREDAMKRDRVRLDVVHRPFQVGSEADVAVLRRLGERLVITNEDLISFHNPSYFKSPSAWQAFRMLTRSALGTADRVVFVSTHARDDALAEDLVDPGRASVVHNGVDHSLRDTQPLPQRPRGADRLGDSAEVILCLGTDFRHKNRVFALRLVAELLRRHHWTGYLALAGPHVTRGSSAYEEARLISLHPQLADSLIDFAVVSESEKAWLLNRAGLVLYPTVQEGFGLVPFEAASVGTPCMWASGTSLSEILPDDAATLVAWDTSRSAARALELLRDDRARERNVSAIRAAGTGMTWDLTADRLLEVYRTTCDSPAVAAGARERMASVRVGLPSEDAMRLLGPGGLLPEEVERPLLALSTHPQIGRPVFGAIKAGYRASYMLRRWRTNGRTK
jgi:glycosyltransferase involved in cell wall biosynthesis